MRVLMLVGCVFEVVKLGGEETGGAGCEEGTHLEDGECVPDEDGGVGTEDSGAADTGASDTGGEPSDGYFLLGHYNSGWECVNYYALTSEDVTDDLNCEGCDFSLLVQATWVEGALVDEHEECAWEDLERWRRGTDFEMIWGFGFYGRYPLAWYFMEPYGEFYPFGEFWTGPDDGDGYYLEWILLANHDSEGALELGYFHLLGDAAF